MNRRSRLLRARLRGQFQPRTKSGRGRVWRVMRGMRHPAGSKPAGNEVTGSSWDLSAVDNPVTSFPAGGGVENNGFARPRCFVAICPLSGKLNGIAPEAGWGPALLKQDETKPQVVDSAGVVRGWLARGVWWRGATTGLNSGYCTAPSLRAQAVDSTDELSWDARRASRQIWRRGRRSSSKLPPLRRRRGG